jgi:hypothetical protein
MTTLRAIGANAPVNETVVRTLERALESARAGEMQFVMLITVDNNKATGNGWSSGEDGALFRIPSCTVLGAIEDAKLEWWHRVVRNA